jgi:hypothetical protein
MLIFHEELFRPMPMPYLLLQLAVVAGWGFAVSWSVQKWGGRGFRVLATAPVILVGWFLVALLCLYLVCAFEGSCL